MALNGGGWRGGGWLTVNLKAVYYNIRKSEEESQLLTSIHQISFSFDNWIQWSLREAERQHGPNPGIKLADIFRWEPEGCYCHRHCKAIAPFWFSTDDIGMIDYYHVVSWAWGTYQSPWTKEKTKHSYTQWQRNWRGRGRCGHLAPSFFYPSNSAHRTIERPFGG